MIDSALHALSPLDGRYRSKVAALEYFFSEYAFIKYRLQIEIDYLLYLSQKKIIKPFSLKEKELLKKIVEGFNEKEAQKIKEIETKTHHDVKAIEYYLVLKLDTVKSVIPFIHIGLTSEDINSIMYGIVLQSAIHEVLLPQMRLVIEQLGIMAKREKKTVMLARTHGQPAVPTTLGKELMLFASRLYEEYSILEGLKIQAKLSGAVGNHNAHTVLSTHIDWTTFSESFIRSYGLEPASLSTQIVSADSYVRIFHAISLINTILIGLDQDMWRYISDEYFGLPNNKDEVGSSTMPQKVNPIDFENSEGNLGVANSLLAFFSEKLPISRLQRDLSDSTVKRNMGIALGYSLLGYQSVLTGLKKVQVNTKKLQEDLDDHWEIIGEGIQTVLRMYGDSKAYERLKKFTRGRVIDKKDIQEFISKLEVSTEVKKRLLTLSPLTYYGLAEVLVDRELKRIRFTN